MINSLSKSGLFFVLLSLVIVIEAEERIVTVGDITTKVLGQSGKITIYSGANATDSVKITFDFLKEIDTEGNEIKGQSQHSFNTFASQDFTFSEIENTTFGANNVSVTQFSFTASINIEGKTATLMSYIYIFTEEGNITVDNETVTVKSGDVKFNAEVKSWPFCGAGDVTCGTGQTVVTGKYLDFGIEMKGKNEDVPMMSETNGTTYSLGNDTKLIVPKQVIYDGNNTKDMPAGYPMLDIQGAKQLFIFRFEIFTTSALYDPIISLDGTTPVETTTNAPTTPANTVTLTDTSVNVNVDVLKTSGKMTAMSGTKHIEVTFHKLTEVMADGTAIRTTGHSIDSFASQQFTFSEMADDTLQSIAVKKIAFMSDLTNAANLKVYLYLFKGEGNLTNGDEKIMVKKGAMKFSIELTNWKFCGDPGVTCTNDNAAENSTHLDFEFTVMGSSEPKMQTAVANEGQVYDVGNGMVTFLTKYQKDDVSTFTAMPTGYPMYNKQGNAQIFKLRFEKFSTKLMYDPVIMFSEDETSSGNTIGKTSVTAMFSLFYFIFKVIM